jgi:Na+/glutamate symporter
VSGGGHSKNYPKIVEYEESLKVPFVLSVIGLILSMGIGPIFSLIAALMLKKVTAPQLDNLTVEDQAALMKAQHKQQTTTKMIVAAILIFAIAFALGMIIGAIISVA